MRVAQSNNGCSPGRKPLDGVSVERRSLVHVSLASLVALLLNGPKTLLSADDRLSSPLSWDDLLRDITDRAEVFTRSLSRADEEIYLRALSGVIERLTKAPDWSQPPGEPVSAQWMHEKYPLIIMHLKLEPGASIPYHDHREYNGVLRVVEGEVAVRKFEIVGQAMRPPRDVTFQIRETQQARLAAGATSSVSHSRDNIHDIRAGPRGARLLDFFTLLSRNWESIYLAVDEPDPATGLCNARWA